MKATLFISLILMCVCRPAYGQMGGLDELRDSLKLELAKAANDSSRVLIMVDLSFAYDGKNTDSEGLYGHEALARAEKMHYQRGEARSLNALALYLQQGGEYPKSLEYLYRSIKISEKGNLVFEKAMSYNLIGNGYWSLGDFPKLIKFTHVSQGLFMSVANEPGVVKWVNNNYLQMAGGYLELNLDSAYVYLKKFYDLTLTDRYWHAPALTNLGDYYARKGDHENALPLVREGVYLAELNNDNITTSQGSATMARLFNSIMARDSAIFYAKKGLKASYALGFGFGIYVNSKLLAEIYEQVDLREALSYRKIYDSVNEATNGPKKLQELQKTLADEQERQQFARLEVAERETRLKQSGFMGLLAVMMFIAFGLYRNILQKKRVNDLLQAQNQKVEVALTELRSTQAQLVQSEKMASLGELTAGIAHEIQNPLNFVNNFAEINKDLVEDLKSQNAKVKTSEYDQEEVVDLLKDLEQNTAKIALHGKRADGIVKSMLQHSRTSSGQKEPTDIAALADEYLKLAYHGMRAKDKDFNCIMETDFEPGLPKVNVIPQDIGRVVLNLYNNAFQAVMERKQRGEVGYEPKVRVEVRGSRGPSPTLPAEQGGGRSSLVESVTIQVTDNGPGIPEAIRNKIFQPFFTTKPTGQGTGLGLSLSYDIVVKGHGGTLSLGPSISDCAEFIIHLPSNS